MAALNDLPDVKSFLGFIDLQNGAMIIAAIGIVHPMAYGCTFFMAMSYLLVTVWVLVALFFAASVILFVGVAQGDAILYAIWIWYTLIFVSLMLMMMILLGVVFASKRQPCRVIIVVLGIFWYILTAYFVLVVNSQRKRLGNSTISEKMTEKVRVSVKLRNGS